MSKGNKWETNKLERQQRSPDGKNKKMFVIKPSTQLVVRDPIPALRIQSGGSGWTEPSSFWWHLERKSPPIDLTGNVSYCSLLILFRVFTASYYGLRITASVKWA